MVESQSGNKVLVAEMGNKRQGISDEDVLQAINDLSTWLSSKGYGNLKEGEKTGESTKLHKHLHLLLSKHNGGMQFEETYVGLSLEDIMAVKTSTEPHMPFAKDIDGNLMCLESETGLVVVWD